MAISSLASFTHHLKSDPHVNFHSFRSELFQEAMNTQNAILGQYGLLFIFLTELEWNNLPGNLITAEILAVPEILGVAAAVLAEPAVYRARYDFTTPVPPCALNAGNAVLATFKLLTDNKALVYGAYTVLRNKLINSIAEEDVSEISVYPFGIGTSSAAQIYAHLVERYSILSQTDFTTIGDRLRTVKSAAQTYAALASVHRDLHDTMLHAQQPLAELDKCNYFLEALKNDPSGLYAAQLYTQQQPLLHTRTFAGLVAHVILHARNHVPNVLSMHYGASAAAVGPVAALAATDLAKLTAENAQLKKDIEALRNGKSTNGGGTAKTRTKYYCWVHGTCNHAGSQCSVMLADTGKYSAAHLSATSHTAPPGGKK